MNLNYFAIMDAADKEMAQSAMLRFLLYCDAFFVKRLFPAFGGNPEGLRVTLEESLKGKRLDLVARSQDEQTLVVENKFKSFPYLAQLEGYDALLKKSWTSGTPVKYLLCFDDSGVPFCRDKQVQTTRGIWHVATYRDIQKAIAEWQGSPGYAAEDEKSIFCRHYAAYLDAYYTAYDLVFADYSQLFSEENKKKAKTPQSGISLEDITAPWADLNFWRNLALRHAGNNIAAATGMDIVFDSGLAKAPVIDILPQEWTSLAPWLCIQVQGLEAKLYVRDIKKFGESARNAMLLYAGKLQEGLPEAGRIEAGKMHTQAITKKSNSFAVYKEQALAGAMPVTAIPERILEFYRRVDGAVRGAGRFAG